MNAHRTIRGLLLACTTGLVLFLSACGGGGGGGGGTNPTTNPFPTLTSISPTGAVTGGSGFTLTANGSSFISGSVVRWNGSSRPTTFVSSTQLTAEIPASDIAVDGTAVITVFNPAPGGGTSGAKSLTISTPSPLAILTTALPPTAGGKSYDFLISATGGITPLSWSVSAGVLPGGLNLNAATGQITGTANAVASDTSFPFTIKATDSSSTPVNSTKALSITVRAAGLGSNNTRAGATPISNGTLAASISPYGDEDFYSFHATAGNTVTLEIFARRLTPASELDSAIEIVDGSGTRPTTCISPDHPLDLVNLVVNDPTPTSFDDECVDDDIELGVIQDSKLQFQPSVDGTYYVHVVDLRGDGRPDLNYELTLSGAD